VASVKSKIESKRKEKEIDEEKEEKMKNMRP